ncbi:MAG: peptide chain release factor N(5)-glutamine methyltransferase [Opitutaceae bacterium]|jgi:release factor glutamine methyltransferase|nr:peptide chain release factor N(5)-glutamine methyltransferase [Opitutaceae bacterium]
MASLLEILRKSADFLAARGVEPARLNAELLAGHALGLGRMQLYLQFERELTEAELARMRPLLRRRGQREPLQYVTGWTEWCGLRLKTDRRALAPRPETEYLVELTRERLGDKAPSRILDLGTGTGCVALALAAAFPNAEVVAADASDGALALAAENAAALGLAERVRFAKSDWFSEGADWGRFDLIAANPPYLTERELAEAEPEVREFEPAAALVSGDGGCADLKKIIAGAGGFLTEGGLLALETGVAQHATLEAAAKAAGFSRVECREDLAGRPRFVFARR